MFQVKNDMTTESTTGLDQPGNGQAHKAELNGAAKEVHQERRKLAMKLAILGFGPVDIADLCEITRSEAKELINTNRRPGDTAFKSRSSPLLQYRRKLTQLQERSFCEEICTTAPEDHGHPPVLWDSNIVHELIQQLAEIHLSQSATKVYLKRWGFIPRRALRKAFDLQPNEVRYWMKKEYPAIAARARARNAEILWIDRSLLKDPASGAKHTLLSLSNNKGHLQWIVRPYPLEPHHVTELLDRGTFGRDRRMFILAGTDMFLELPEVQAWMDKRKEVIEFKLTLPFLKMGDGPSTKTVPEQ